MPEFSKVAHFFPLRETKSISLHSPYFKGCSPYLQCCSLSVVIFTFINVFTLVESLQHTAQLRQQITFQRFLSQCALQQNQSSHSPRILEFQERSPKNLLEFQEISRRSQKSPSKISQNSPRFFFHLENFIKIYFF